MPLKGPRDERQRLSLPEFLYFNPEAGRKGEKKAEEEKVAQERLKGVGTGRQHVFCVKPTEERRGDNGTLTQLFVFNPIQKCRQRMETVGEYFTFNSQVNACQNYTSQLTGQKDSSSFCTTLKHLTAKQEFFVLNHPSQQAFYLLQKHNDTTKN